MPLDNYFPASQVWCGHLPELYCSLTIHKMHPSSTNRDCVRVYVDIDYDSLHNGVTYQPAMDLTYTQEEYDTLLDTGMLVDNVKIHYLQTEAISRGLDEYFH